jgi:hypothetical protein
VTQPAVAVPHLVPMTRTPLEPKELAAQFAKGFELATGHKTLPSRKLLQNALGIVGVENGNGRAIICYNWGNVSCTPLSWNGGMWQHPEPQSGQPLYFRAYQNHDQGSRAWWRLMLGNAKHRKALVWAAKGRPDLMVQALYDSHYVVGGSKRAYQRAAALLADNYRTQRVFDLWPAYGYADTLISPAAAVAGMAGAGIWRWLGGTS